MDSYSEAKSAVLYSTEYSSALLVSVDVLPTRSARAQVYVSSELISSCTERLATDPHGYKQTARRDSYVPPLLATETQSQPHLKLAQIAVQNVRCK